MSSIALDLDLFKDDFYSNLTFAERLEFELTINLIRDRLPLETRRSTVDFILRFLFLCYNGQTAAAMSLMSSPIIKEYLHARHCIVKETSSNIDSHSDSSSV